MEVSPKFFLQAPAWSNATSLFEWWMPPARRGDPLAVREFSAQDIRPGQAAKAFGREGSLKGLRVLELGPWEANQTPALEALGADILSVEGNAEGFLKCLIIKEALALKARFLLGNFLPMLEENPDRYDLIYASGVLYHMPDPFQLLRAIAMRTDQVFIWTHHFEPSNSQGRQPSRVTRDGLELTYHLLPNAGREINPKWMGGLSDTAAWMTREDILRALDHVGFRRVDVLDDVPATAEAPAHFTLAAWKA